MAVLPCGWCGAPDLHAIGEVGDIGDPATSLLGGLTEEYRTRVSGDLLRGNPSEEYFPLIGIREKEVNFTYSLMQGLWCTVGEELVARARPQYRIPDDQAGREETSKMLSECKHLPKRGD
jgi:hypothetical protein